ncbi:hypothetical protein ACK36T_03385 [Aeromonas veronii]
MVIYSPLLAPHILARRLQSGRACITELGLEQRCPRCGEFWPWDTEFFGVASDASGLSSWCRGCLNEHYQQLRGAGQHYDSKAERKGGK